MILQVIQNPVEDLASAVVTVSAEEIMSMPQDKYREYTTLTREAVESGRLSLLLRALVLLAEHLEAQAAIQRH